LACILVIDDDPQILLLLSSIIEDKGHQVVTARNGAVALAAFDSHRVDLIVTDLFMPEQEGFETISVLRKRQASPKILAISGHRFGEFLDMAITLGADAALPKPFSASVLLAAIDRLLAEAPPESGRPHEQAAG
jgi:DNA-binding response OmpR family regulator